MKVHETLARVLPILFLPRLYSGTCRELFRLKNNGEVEPKFYADPKGERKCLESEFHFTNNLRKAILHALDAERSFKIAGYEQGCIEPIVLELTSLNGLEATIYPQDPGDAYPVHWILRGQLDDRNSRIRSLEYDRQRNDYVLRT